MLIWCHTCSYYKQKYCCFVLYRSFVIKDCVETVYNLIICITSRWLETEDERFQKEMKITLEKKKSKFDGVPISVHSQK